MDKRIGWIDFEKGFILLSVCMGHCKLPCHTATFHMAAFFFISGLLYNADKYPSLKQYFFRKYYSLLKPYICLSLLFLLIYPPIYDTSYVYTYPHIIEKLLDPIGNDYIKSILLKISLFSIDIIMGESSPNTNPLWFVYSLFQISCIFAIINRLCNKISLYRIIIFIVCIICFLTGWYLSINNIAFPFKLHTAITGLSFYGMGHLSKVYFKKKIKTSPLWLNITLCIFTFLLFLYGYSNIPEGYIGYIHNSLGHSFKGYFFASIFGTLFCTITFYLFSFIYLSLVNYIKSILNYIANNGIVVLAVHYYVISCCLYFSKRRYDDDLYHILVFLLIILFIFISVPLFNKHLYWMIGKKKITK